jgi:hypothetical protein
MNQPRHGIVDAAQKDAAGTRRPMPRATDFGGNRYGSPVCEQSREGVSESDRHPRYAERARGGSPHPTLSQVPGEGFEILKYVTRVSVIRVQ